MSPSVVRIRGGNLVAISAGLSSASSPRRSDAPPLYIAAVSNSVTPAATAVVKAAASSAALFGPP